MKKQLHIKPIVSLLFLFVVSISLQAQQFEWAKSYSGQDDPLNSSGLYNRIFNSVFDSQGNIYISGTFGTGALIDTTHDLNDMYYPTSGVFPFRLRNASIKFTGNTGQSFSTFAMSNISDCGIISTIS